MLIQNQFVKVTIMRCKIDIKYSVNTMDRITRSLYFPELNRNNMDMKVPTIVFVEGNIGSGKSTLVKQAYENYKDNDKVLFLQEPVDEWKTICDEEGKDIISNYYADQKAYGFKFQMMAYITRLKGLKDAMKENRYSVIICERSLNTDRMYLLKCCMMIRLSMRSVIRFIRDGLTVLQTFSPIHDMYI